MCWWVLQISLFLPFFGRQTPPNQTEPHRTTPNQHIPYPPKLKCKSLGLGASQGQPLAKPNKPILWFNPGGHLFRRNKVTSAISSEHLQGLLAIPAAPYQGVIWHHATQKEVLQSPLHALVVVILTLGSLPMCSPAGPSCLKHGAPEAWVLHCASMRQHK